MLHGGTHPETRCSRPKFASNVRGPFRSSRRRREHVVKPAGHRLADELDQRRWLGRGGISC